MKKKFCVDIWSLINIENLNNHLEKVLDEENADGIPSDIDYDCIEITAEGTLTVEAEFNLEKIE